MSAYIPIFGNLIHDSMIEIFKCFDGVDRYKMSMVAKDWRKVCAVKELETRYDMKKACYDNDILYILKHTSSGFKTYVLRKCGKVGNECVIKVLMAKYGYQPELLCGICKGGHYELFKQWIDLYQHQMNLNGFDIAEMAFEGGNMNIINEVLNMIKKR
jgi:hypothetical protein